MCAIPRNPPLPSASAMRSFDIIPPYFPQAFGLVHVAITPKPTTAGAPSPARNPPILRKGTHDPRISDPQCTDRRQASGAGQRSCSARQA